MNKAVKVKYKLQWILQDAGHARSVWHPLRKARGTECSRSKMEDMVRNKTKNPLERTESLHLLWLLGVELGLIFEFYCFCMVFPTILFILGMGIFILCCHILEVCNWYFDFPQDHS